MTNIPHILLAAGNSKRMGEPKQLVPWSNKSLIQHQIETLLPTTDKLVVVIGAYASLIKPQLEGYPIEVIHFKEWENGMGSSLAFAVAELQKTNSDLEGVLISLIDQPLITSIHFLKMRTLFEKGKKQIICSKSESGWLGPPVLFDSYYLNQLRSLTGEQGAKVILNKNLDRVKHINGGKTLVDMDTPEVYKKLLKDINPRS
jgi:molybdenum cofactor cytidylyltransferase